MAMMLRVRNYAVAQSTRVTWWNVQPIPARLIKLVGLDQLVHLAP
jgi:hypothetical protein